MSASGLSATPLTPAVVPGSPAHALEAMRPDEARGLIEPPALSEASPLDLLCARFALQSVLTLGSKFNLRRDINNLVTLAGRCLRACSCMWPVVALNLRRGRARAS